MYVEMQPGDGLMFQCNALHRSDANRSDSPRWSMTYCYNAACNDSYIDSHQPRYTPLHKVPDTAVKEAGRQPAAIAPAPDCSAVMLNWYWLSRPRDLCA